MSVVEITSVESCSIMSAAAEATPQGRAIAEAARKFGDGKTLPFPPCKRYYNPYSEVGGTRTRMYACRLHNDARSSRLEREGGQWREGEKHLDFFWGEDCNKEKSPDKPTKKRRTKRGREK